MRTKPLPTNLHEMFTYAPDTGELRWRRRLDCSASWNTRFAGQVAGTKSRYVQVMVDRSAFKAHRIIWALMTGKDPGEADIDHIDLDRWNLRWNNLRSGSRSQNMANTRVHTDSRTGVKGVHRRENGKYSAQIMVGGGRACLGTYDTAERAHAAYAAAATSHFGEFARAA